MNDDIHCDILVIGSGPGGTLTAALLAEAGKDVVLVEEGAHIPAGKVASYSLAEMDLKYRHGGLAVTMGKTKISYVEGCCVGGASEINAGLYNRPSAETLRDWAIDYRLRDFSPELLEPNFQVNEKDLGVCPFPQELLPASRIIQAAAQSLGWQGMEVPRMWHYGSNKRQSMTEVFIPRFLKAQGRLLSRSRIQRLQMLGRKACEARTRLFRIRFKHVFVCGGAIQTPLLLRRSGLRRNVGNSLRMHPAVRVVARFSKEVNDPGEGVPVYQVTEFKPDITLGGSYSGVPHLALWLAGRSDFSQNMEDPRKLAIFYALTKASAQGRVRGIPLIDEPWVTMNLAKTDWTRLQDGLARLRQLLEAAGADQIFMPERLDLSTIHLFSSVPMGEDVNRCALDSYGKLHGYDNIYVNDASMLPASPGANPQAVIMAVARRNVEHFLKCVPS